ncbi:MAG: UDP-N-acetylmuramate--alanine ligase [Bacteroidales bacterium]|nr:UDP-N-acetylmuramate--alanine ligase [Bacteroidales bacterium]
MKRVHFMSIGDPHLCELAIAMKDKGFEVSCSGVDIMEPVRGKLIEHSLLPEKEGWFPEKLDGDYDFVIPANDVSVDNPEFIRSKELNLLILSYPEYIFSRIKNKSRILVFGNNNKNEVIKMILYSMHKHNYLLDYIVSPTLGIEPSLLWNYDSRMAVLEDDKTFSPFIKKQINEYYRPHILVLTDFTFQKENSLLSEEQYIESLKRLISSIERDGKLIYNEKDSTLSYLASLVRDDITAMPYSLHAYKEENQEMFITSRFGDFKVNKVDSSFLENLNAARNVCKQMGLKDKDFYEAVSEYSFL